MREAHVTQRISEDRLISIRRGLDNPHDADQLEQISTMLNIESNRLSQYLSDATSVARSDFPINAHLKFLPVDVSGRVMEPLRYRVNDENIPVSDAIKLLRSPTGSDRFHISEPVTFEEANDAAEFEHVDNHRRIDIVEAATRRSLNGPVELNVKSIPFDQIPSVIQPAGRALSVVDSSNEQVLSEPIEFLDQPPSASGLALATFLIDERTNERVQLTPEQHRIITQQAEFTPRTCLTYLVNSENVVVSKPIRMSATAQQLSHASDRAVLHRLSIYQNKREQLLADATHATNPDQLEKFIEKILPLLGENRRAFD
jgi:hypothetical protein